MPEAYSSLWRIKLMTNRNRIRLPRMPRMWGVAIANGTIAVATSAGKAVFNLQANLESDIGSTLHDATASAIRLNVNYRLQSATTGDDNTVACGIGWVNERAIAAGATSVPSPIDDHFDWMFHDIRTLSASRDVTDKDEQVLGSFMQIRNNSMRKQRENSSTLVAVFEAEVLESVALQIFLGGRVLFLNP